MCLKVIGIIILSWVEDEGGIHKNRSNNALYFTEALVIILSSTAMLDSIQYDEDTWFLDKIKYSVFTWDFRKYTKTIYRSETFLPDLEIHTGFSKFLRFFKRLGSVLKGSVFNFEFDSIITQEEPRKFNPMYFTPEF